MIDFARVFYIKDEPFFLPKDLYEEVKKRDGSMFHTKIELSGFNHTIFHYSYGKWKLNKIGREILGFKIKSSKLVENVYVDTESKIKEIVGTTIKSFDRRVIFYLLDIYLLSDADEKIFVEILEKDIKSYENA